MRQRCGRPGPRNTRVPGPPGVAGAAPTEESRVQGSRGRHLQGSPRVQVVLGVQGAVPTEGSPDSGVQGTAPTGESPGPGGPGGPGDTYRGIPGSRGPGSGAYRGIPGSRGRRPAGGMGWDSRGRVAERRPLVAANTRTQHTQVSHRMEPRSETMGVWLFKQT